MKRPEHAEAMRRYWKQAGEKRKAQVRKQMSITAKTLWSDKRTVMLRATRKNIAKAQSLCHTSEQLRKFSQSMKIAHKLPRSEKQMDHARESIFLAQKANCRKKAYLKGLKIMQALPRSPKQLAVLKRAQRLKGSNPSKIQRQFSNRLKKYLPSLRFNDYLVKAKGHQYRPDIVNVETRRIVEVDGAYWHDEEKDRIRDFNLRSAGWKVLHLPADRKFLFKRRTIRRALAFLRKPTLHIVNTVAA